MRSPPQSMRDLAARLLEVSRPASEDDLHEASVVIETLRGPLTRFIGNEGFTSLLRRAVTLASEDAPSLRGIQVSADGRLRRGEAPAIRKNGGANGVDAEAAIAVAAHFLGLLVTFIGERLTTRLVQQAWPAPPSNVRDSGNEDER
jgi:hypothetical protein